MWVSGVLAWAASAWIGFLTGMIFMHLLLATGRKGAGKPESLRRAASARHCQRSRARLYRAWALGYRGGRTTGTLERIAFQFTPEHLPPEEFLDVLEDQGMTCDLEDVQHGWMGPGEHGARCAEEAFEGAIPITCTIRWGRLGGKGWARLN